ncbi:hypothetical protein BLNAU_1719 [Blattamonas nauphoetae]|uniref:TOG domain-containing protein n=1 Tax=Blattamonas nauphoetae TaxID=2049346 RepID=A0ABQ9YHP3_9EUKA|nr:hypothetical protein BLNAU_1719 [Blattamonas nauphoetae]
MSEDLDISAQEPLEENENFDVIYDAVSIEDLPGIIEAYSRENRESQLIMAKTLFHIVAKNDSAATDIASSTLLEAIIKEIKSGTHDELWLVCVVLLCTLSASIPDSFQQNSCNLVIMSLRSMMTTSNVEIAKQSMTSLLDLISSNKQMCESLLNQGYISEVSMRLKEENVTAEDKERTLAVIEGLCSVGVAVEKIDVLESQIKDLENDEQFGVYSKAAGILKYFEREKKKASDAQETITAGQPGEEEWEGGQAQSNTDTPTPAPSTQGASSEQVNALKAQIAQMEQTHVRKEELVEKENEIATLRQQLEQAKSHAAAPSAAPASGGDQASLNAAFSVIGQMAVTVPDDKRPGLLKGKILESIIPLIPTAPSADESQEQLFAAISHLTAKHQEPLLDTILTSGIVDTVHQYAAKGTSDAVPRSAYSFINNLLQMATEPEQRDLLLEKHVLDASWSLIKLKQKEGTADILTSLNTVCTELQKKYAADAAKMGAITGPAIPALISVFSDKSIPIRTQGLATKVFALLTKGTKVPPEAQSLFDVMKECAGNADTQIMGLAMHTFNAVAACPDNHDPIVNGGFIDTIVPFLKSTTVTTVNQALIGLNTILSKATPATKAILKQKVPVSDVTPHLETKALQKAAKLVEDKLKAI